MAKKKPTILQLRTMAIQEVIQEEVEYYLSRVLRLITYKRACATCGRKFIPRQRWHFFCMSDCRKVFYAGQFKRRVKQEVKP